MMNMWDMVRKVALNAVSSPKRIVAHRILRFLTLAIIGGIGLLDKPVWFVIWCLTFAVTGMLYYGAYGCSVKPQQRAYFRVIYCIIAIIALWALCVIDNGFMRFSIAISRTQGIITETAFLVLLYGDSIKDYIVWKKRLDNNDLYYSEVLETVLRKIEKRSSAISIVEWIVDVGMIISLVYSLVFDVTSIDLISFFCKPVTLLLLDYLCFPEWILLQYQSIKKHSQTNDLGDDFW